jgi:hypothetical protein
MDAPQHALPPHHRPYQPMLAGNIQQHHADCNRQNALPRNPRHRQQHSEPDQQHARQILADDSEQPDQRMPARPQLIVVDEITRRQSHDQRAANGQADRKRQQKNSRRPKQ